MSRFFYDVDGGAHFHIGQVRPVFLEQQPGCAAIERAAIEGGAEPLTGDYIEGRMPDGTVLAITANGYEASKVAQENREMKVFSVDEVGVVLEKWLNENKVVGEAKSVFPGAVIESITKNKLLLDDEIPF